MRLLAFLKKDFLIMLIYRFRLLLQLLSGVLFLAMFYFIGKTFSGSLSPYLAQYGGEYFPYLLVGAAVSTFVFVGLNELADKIRDAQVMGTLEALLSTPTSLYTILLGNSLWSFITAFIEAIGILAGGILFLQLQIGLVNALCALLVLLLTFTAFLSVGILAAAFIMIFKQGNPIGLLFGTSSYAIGGVIFPVEVLPAPFRILSQILPLTHSTKALRELLLAGTPPAGVLPEISLLLLFSALAAPASLVFFRYAVKRARRDGSLVQY